MDTVLIPAVALIGAVVALTVMLRRRGAAEQGPVRPVPAAESEPWCGREEMLGVLRQLPGAVLVVSSDGSPVYASEDARRRGLVRREGLVFDEIADLARQTIERGSPVTRELTLRRPPLRKASLDVRIRGIWLPSEEALVLVDDLTEARRVADVRRDFIANVSHELKTPVGAISLLAEAIMTASDDKDAVEHFAQRMLIESRRLANLVNDLIDLSRLQVGNPLAEAEPLLVDNIVAEAVDHVRAAAEAKSIEVVIGGAKGLQVLGNADQLVTAVRNLLANAIAYSPEHTRVAVAVRLRDSTVAIAVKDQGIGIEEQEQSRIFERFYRVDAARSRVTGGTGLGLAIVRNVCRNHGGDATVWSVVGEGSTFTIHLPEYTPGQGGELERRLPRAAERSNQ